MGILLVVISQFQYHVNFFLGEGAGGGRALNRLNTFWRSRYGNECMPGALISNVVGRRQGRLFEGGRLFQFFQIVA